MVKKLTKIMTEQAIPIIFVGLISIIVLIFFMSVKIGQSYRESITIEELDKIPVYEKSELSIRSIRLRRGKENVECIEVYHNGSFREHDCNTLETIKKGYLGLDQVDKFYDIFDVESFESLETLYTGGDTYYTITIETNYGTKTIVVEPGEGEVPGSIQDLIDEIEDEEDIIFATPGPTFAPTATPVSSATPVPTSSPVASPTPQPSPTPSPPSGSTPEPFNCSMLGDHDWSITVSNIVCLPDEE